jgi:hypothetical protein
MQWNPRYGKSTHTRKRRPISCCYFYNHPESEGLHLLSGKPGKTASLEGCVEKHSASKHQQVEVIKEVPTLKIPI